MFVITASQDGKDNGCICNTAIQAAGGEIPIITVAVNKANLTCERISKTKKLTLSILSEDASFDTFKHFGFQSGRDVDKFADCGLTREKAKYVKAPLIAESPVNIECRVIEKMFPGYCLKHTVYYQNYYQKSTIG